MSIKKSSDKVVVPIIYFLSVLVPVLVTILMFLPERYNLVGSALEHLPLFHAVLNGITAIFLFVGVYFIKAKNPVLHKASMLSALSLSVIFLGSYVISKIGAGPVGYCGEWRMVYLPLLISHIILAAIIVPLALFTIYRAFTTEYEKHKKLARFTYPIWMYVAVTGVLVYLFMIDCY